MVRRKKRGHRHGHGHHDENQNPLREHGATKPAKSRPVAARHARAEPPLVRCGKCHEDGEARNFGEQRQAIGGSQAREPRHERSGHGDAGEKNDGHQPDGDPGEAFDERTAAFGVRNSAPPSSLARLLRNTAPQIV